MVRWLLTWSRMRTRSTICEIRANGGDAMADGWDAEAAIVVVGFGAAGACAALAAAETAAGTATSSQPGSQANPQANPQADRQANPQANRQAPAGPSVL